MKYFHLNLLLVKNKLVCIFKICNIKHIYLLNKQKKMMYFFNLFSI